MCEVRFELFTLSLRLGFRGLRLSCLLLFSLNFGRKTFDLCLALGNISNRLFQTFSDCPQALSRFACFSLFFGKRLLGLGPCCLFGF